MTTMKAWIQRHAVLISPVYLPGVFTRDDWMARLIMGLTSAVAVGICEELVGGVRHT